MNIENTKKALGNIVTNVNNIEQELEAQEMKNDDVNSYASMIEKIMNRGLGGKLAPNEFKVLYIISFGCLVNNKACSNDLVAELSGLSVRQATRITKSLEEKGFIEGSIKQVSKTIKAKFYRLSKALLDNIKNDFKTI